MGGRAMERREFMKKAGLTVLAAAIAPRLLALGGELPYGFQLYDVNGQSEFPIYSHEEGLATESVSYLISEDRKLCWGFNPSKRSLVAACADFKAALRSEGIAA